MLEVNGLIPKRILKLSSDAIDRVAKEKGLTREELKKMLDQIRGEDEPEVFLSKLFLSFDDYKCLAEEDGEAEEER